MSFSANIKEEILNQDIRRNDWSLSFVAGISAFALNVYEDKMEFHLDNEKCAKRVSFFCKKLFNINDGLLEPMKFGKADGFLLTYDKKDGEIILKGLCPDNEFCEDFSSGAESMTDFEILRHFVMGAYMGGGFMLPPEKFYHLEFVAKRKRALDELSYVLDKFGEIPKRVKRDRYFVTYIKNYESIDNIISVLGASKCLMELMNIKIEKEAKNEINRKNNFEVANIAKTSEASRIIIADIENIMYTVGLDALPESLSEIALLRLANPEESLAQLAKLSGLSRSGVNHRLQKISEIAREL